MNHWSFVSQALLRVAFAASLLAIPGIASSATFHEFDFSGDDRSERTIVFSDGVVSMNVRAAIFELGKWSKPKRSARVSMDYYDGLGVIRNTKTERSSGLDGGDVAEALFFTFSRPVTEVVLYVEYPRDWDINRASVGYFVPVIGSRNMALGFTRPASYFGRLSPNAPSDVVEGFGVGALSSRDRFSISGISFSAPALAGGEGGVAPVPLPAAWMFGLGGFSLLAAVRAVRRQEPAVRGYKMKSAEV